MLRLIFPAFYCTFSLLCLLLSIGTATAETWTDITGKFSIDAKFTGVEGKSIVLVKPSGNRVTVPIAKLSPESRAQAKSLYLQMQASTDKSTAASSRGGGTDQPQKQPSRSLGFEPPVVPTTEAMKPFPESLSVQQMIDFVKEQIKAGHPEVFWYMMPSEMRDTFDDPQLRQAANPFVDQQSQMKKQIEPLVFKAIEVLVTKKSFVLGSELMSQIPPDVEPSLRTGYDPGVGILYELADLGFTVDFSEQSVKEVIDTHAPRIGAHLSELLKIVPKEQFDSVFDGLQIEMIDDSHAVVRMEQPGAGSSEPAKDTELILVSGRWVLTDIHDTWVDLKGKLDSGSFEKEMQEMQAKASEQAQQTQMMAGMFIGVATTVLDSLLAANTQAEFDNSLRQVTAMLMPKVSIEGDAGEIQMQFGDDQEGMGTLEFQSTGSEPAYEVPPGPAPEGWTMDLSSTTIPQSPLVGVVGGQAVKMTDARIENGILHLQDQADMFDANQIVVFLFMDEGERVEGKSFNITPTSGFSSPHIHQNWKAAESKKTEMFTSSYAMQLKFGQAKNGMIPGEIYLCLPNKTMIRGTFDAKAASGTCGN